MTPTSMLPLVAFEYGQKPCARAASWSAVAWSTPSISTDSYTARPTPLSVVPNCTAAVVVDGPHSMLFCAAMNCSAPLKHAE